MHRPTAKIQLSEEEAGKLRELTRRGKSEQRLVERARIVLLASEGRSNQQIAAALHTRTATRF